MQNIVQLYLLAEIDSANMLRMQHRTIKKTGDTVTDTSRAMTTY